MVRIFRPASPIFWCTASISRRCEGGSRFISTSLVLSNIPASA